MTNHLWQSTVFAAVAALIAWALKGNRASVRYWVWLSASAKFLVPFAVLMSWGSHVSWAPKARAMATPRVTVAVGEMARPFGDLDLVGLEKTRREPDWVPMAGLGIWMVGFVGVGVKRWGDWRRVRGAVRGSRRWQGMALPHIEIRVAPGLLEPGVVGIFRQVLLLPAGIVERLSPEQMRGVLAHELCHVRRRDNLTAAFHMVVEAIFWFHPLVWWIGARLVEERERACDEDVVRNNCEPRVYVDGILNVCKFYVESPLRCVSGVTGSDIKKRVEAIMMRRIGKNLDFAKRALLAAAAVMSVAVPLGIGMLQAQAPPLDSFSGLQTVATRKFDVATIKPAAPDAQGWHLSPPKRGEESIGNLELRKIVASSFRIQDSMVFGPAWMDSVKYDILGKGPDANATSPEVWEMMRSLLRDRFQMQYHIETREAPIYALTVAKGGPKLRDAATGRCAAEIKAGVTTCNGIQFLPFGVGIYNLPIGGLTGGLGRWLQQNGQPLRPIVDKTGLTGKYDIQVTWMPEGITAEQLQSIPKEERPEDVTMFQAFEKQAGLKLEATKGPIQVVVVDRIERPSEN
jgi:bla regulator protein blaR1